MKKVEMFLNKEDLEYVANLAMQKVSLNKGMEMSIAVMMVLEDKVGECTDHTHSEVMTTIKNRTNPN
jgi:chorismate mutase